MTQSLLGLSLDMLAAMLVFHFSTTSSHERPPNSGRNRSHSLREYVFLQESTVCSNCFNSFTLRFTALKGHLVDGGMLEGATHVCQHCPKHGVTCTQRKLDQLCP